MAADYGSTAQESVEDLYRQALAIQSLLETLKVGVPVPEQAWYLMWYLSRGFVTRVDELRSLLSHPTDEEAAASRTEPNQGTQVSAS